jgi:hypothetical protein
LFGGRERSKNQIFRRKLHILRKNSTNTYLWKTTVEERFNVSSSATDTSRVVESVISVDIRRIYEKKCGKLWAKMYLGWPEKENMMKNIR